MDWVDVFIKFIILLVAWVILETLLKYYVRMIVRVGREEWYKRQEEDGYWKPYQRR